MFEVGKAYKITTGTGDDLGYSTYSVLAFQAPLLKVRGGATEVILSTASPMFVSAELYDPELSRGPQSKLMQSLSDDFAS